MSRLIARQGDDIVWIYMYGLISIKVQQIKEDKISLKKGIIYA